jgi:hypothetical protein
MPSEDTSPRPPLTKERVLQAAIGLADREGLDALTMRRLGSELGVEAMSLVKPVVRIDVMSCFFRCWCSSSLRVLFDRDGDLSSCHPGF